MYKVLIIDDEPIIRKGLRNIVNWRQFDCEICGEASDGMEGKELIKSTIPDIIFTDIRMPGVDGLAMIREIKELVSYSKIIILTGYRDFEYAQESIRLGAFDYILKPSKIEELTSVIRRAVKELKFQRDKEDELDKLNKLFDQNIPILREKLLYDIIYGINTNEEEIAAKMDLFKVTIGKFILIIVENEGETDYRREELDTPENDGGNQEIHQSFTQYNAHLYQFGIINNFEEIFSDKYSVINISLNNKRVAFIVQSNDDNYDEDKFDELIQKKCSYMQEMIENCFGFTVTIAISSEGDGAMQLSSKLKECQEALEHKFYIGNNSIISFKDLNSFFKCEDFSLLENHQKALLEGIKSGNDTFVKSKLEELFCYIESIGNISREYLKNFCWNTVSLINNIRVSVSTADNDKGNISKDISSLFRMIEKCDNIKELNIIIEEIALNVVLKVNSYNNKSIKLILKKAVDYLETHYHEQITLNEVAEYTYVSTYYISRMFKKELKQNFVDYLNEIRMKKAKELLKDVKYKTYEVAEMVGIPDAHYFSKLFKKYVGVTPTEFRET